MEKRPVTVVRPGEKKRMTRNPGEGFVYFVTGKQTGGNYFLLEALIPPGGGPSPHIQTREDEGFYMLEGELVFTADGEAITATAGMFINVPENVVHSFKNESGKNARMLIIFAPAGMENFFGEMALNPANAAAIAEKYGVQLVNGPV